MLLIWAGWPIITIYGHSLIWHVSIVHEFVDHNMHKVGSCRWKSDNAIQRLFIALLYIIIRTKLPHWGKKIAKSLCLYKAIDNDRAALYLQVTSMFLSVSLYIQANVACPSYTLYYTIINRQLFTWTQQNSVGHYFPLYYASESLFIHA